MASDNSSENHYTTTPLKSDGSSFMARYQLNKGNNPYKTPVQQKINSTADIKISKTKSYKSIVIEKLPIYSPTPKSSSLVRNPFEHANLLKERLSQPICSPSMFKAVSSPSQNEDFTWSIEDISMLNPADIDENPSQDFNSWYSPVTESEAQKAINKFFESHLVDLQSPVSVDLKKTKIKKVDEEKTLMLDTWTQTDLTLPPSLPPDVEAILSRFCVFKSQPEYKEDFNNSSGSRKKLLFRECFFSPDNKVKSESITNISTPITSRLSSPNVSPICESTAIDVSMSSKSVKVDLSHNIEICDKENLTSDNWNCQGCSTPRAMM